VKKPPSYWRRQVRRGKIPADDPRAVTIPQPRPSLDAQLAKLPQPVNPARHR
jgi:hypothetical protein